jgi:hypothetical protein
VTESGGSLARINIEDKWWIDLRRNELAKRVGGAHVADGVMIAAWRVSQEFWANERREVPLKQFLFIPHAKTIIEVGLAEEKGDFVYVCGTRQYHEWRILRQEAGRRGAAKSNEIQSSKRQQKSASDQQTSASSSSSSSNTNPNTLVHQPPLVERLYLDLYPRKEGKSSGIKIILKDLGPDELPQLELAIRNYAEACKGREKKYIKIFPSFAKEWRDWIEPHESTKKTKAIKLDFGGTG